LSKKIISPAGRKPKVKLYSLAPRVDILKGKTVALYHNDKVASFPIMRAIKNLLKQQLGITDIYEVHSGTPFSKHPESAIQEALKADVVFAGTCD